MEMSLSTYNYYFDLLKLKLNKYCWLLYIYVLLDWK
jgi:hypothetical protein